jgi:transcriptional regulator with XRE-family HTH domain
LAHRHWASVWRGPPRYSAVGPTGEQLAQKTKQIGHEVTRSVIANIETGRRETVTVQGVAVLAAALGFPPGIGNLRVGEATVGRIDQFLTRTAKKVPTQARHCRTILSGALAMAARHDAIAVNPVRETATIAKKKIEVRALSVDEADQLGAAV